MPSAGIFPRLCGGSLAPDATDLREGGAVLFDAASASEADVGNPPSASADAAGWSIADGGEGGAGPVVDARGNTPAFDAADAMSSDAALGAEVGGALEGGADAVPPDAAYDAGALAVGLVAFYPFDEGSDTTSADVSGNAKTATLNGATFAPGLRGNAVTMSGNNQYVSLPSGIVSAVTSFSIATWVNFRSALLYSRIFDFGTGGNAYMIISPSSLGLRFGITISGRGGEQIVQGPMIPTGKWQHVSVALVGTTCTLYVNGVRTGQNTLMLTPASLGNTTMNWLGKGQFAGDPYLTA